MVAKTVKVAGRGEILDRPMLYDTTRRFAEATGADPLKGLTKAQDLKDPDRK